MNGLWVLLAATVDVNETDTRPEPVKRATAEWERRAQGLSAGGGARHMIDVLQDTLGLNKKQAFAAFTRSQFMQLLDPSMRTADDPRDLGFGRGELHKAVLTPGACARTLDLLDAGANVDERDAHGITPLMLAAGKGWNSRLVSLLAMGADVHATDKLTQATALAHAAFGYNYGAVSLLLAARASADVRLKTNAVPDSDSDAPGIDTTLLQMMNQFEGEGNDDEVERQRVVWLLTDEADLSREGRSFSKATLQVAMDELELYGHWTDRRQRDRLNRVWQRALQYEVHELGEGAKDEL